MFDLGSGDGRIVIMAAQKFKADATGVEFDDALFKQSMDKIKSLGLASTRAHHPWRSAKAGLLFRRSAYRIPAADVQR